MVKKIKRMQYIWDKTPRVKRIVLLKLLKFDKKFSKLNYKQIADSSDGKNLIRELEAINQIRLRQDSRKS